MRPGLEVLVGVSLVEPGGGEVESQPLSLEEATQPLGHCVPAVQGRHGVRFHPVVCWRGNRMHYFARVIHWQSFCGIALRATNVRHSLTVIVC